MAYSQEFREFVVSKVQSGMSRSEAVSFFKIHRNSLTNWLQKYEKTGNVSDKIRKEYKPKKICPQRLLEELDKTPDATLGELSQHFSCSQNSVWQRLKNLGITRKKNQALCRAKRRKKT